MLAIKQSQELEQFFKKCSALMNLLNNKHFSKEIFHNSVSFFFSFFLVGGMMVTLPYY